MATLSQSLVCVKSQLSELLPPEHVEDLARQAGHRWRKSLLGPALTVQLFLLQLLANVALTALRHVADLAVSAQAICKAKMRLPLAVLRALVAASVPDAATSLWKDKEVYLVDGTAFKTPDTPALAKRYGKASNGRGPSSGRPTPKLLALLDLAGGFIRRVITLPATRQEYTCLSRLFSAIPKALGLLLGDAGLVSFTHLALLLQAGRDGCFRLPRGLVVQGRGKGRRRVIRRLGQQDLLVQWSATDRPKWMSAKRWEKLAGTTLTLRQIAYRVCRKGFRTNWAWIITTLIDPVAYPAQDLIELYNKRWQIEVDFRDLKRTLKMALVRSKTVAGVQKEVLVFVLLYNLIRGVMAKAAQQQGVGADRISFIDAARWLLWAGPGAALPRLIVNPIRRRRSPARKLKEARHRYGQLRGTRDATSKPACSVKL